jgi:hypothetical protein
MDERRAARESDRLRCFYLGLPLEKACLLYSPASDPAGEAEPFFLVDRLIEGAYILGELGV